MSEGDKEPPAPVRDLTGRCGTCGFFVKLRTDDKDIGWGDCRLGCWPSPLRDSATCSSHKPIGASFKGALKRKRAAGTPKKYRSDDTVVARPLIPQELGIDMDQKEFRTVLREVLLDELGVRDVAIGDRWSGGKIIIKPGKEKTADKEVDIDVFFKKIVMVREKLRVLEQKVNGNKKLSNDDKVQLQQYITGCYGSLTSFNSLFKNKEDHFVGQSAKKDG